jgi:hydroxymethylglutaryl-CoA reductase
MQLKLPMALGTVGGLTKTHPTAALALKILNNPTAPELMKIATATGLANNFAAVAALVSTGIQHGHMKLHLSNILMAENGTQKQHQLAKRWFASRPISVQAVREFLRNNNEIS